VSGLGGIGGGRAIIPVRDQLTQESSPGGGPSSPGGDIGGSVEAPGEPGDTLATGHVKSRTASHVRNISRRKGIVSQEETHNMPVSYGVSARFRVTDRFSLNTGLTYTLYTSRWANRYSDGTTGTERQSVHYLGIPLRCDWMMVDRPSFGMYAGVGGQVDKCIYARRAGTRLHENEFLWSLNASLGFQYNFNTRISIYLEPELGLELNEGSIETYRSEHAYILAARAGLRINL
jgi:hypothetical protein